jgi:putative tricarboxylic transport membrane protein
MEVLSNLSLGFSVALSLNNVLYCFAGVLLGTLVGVLPGIGTVTTVAMLLPLTFSVPPESALIMLAGIYYGAQYGGSTTSILVNMPGEASSVVTTIDGYQMARQGRAGPALGIAAIGSFFGGCVATLLVALFAPALAKVALQFDPASYFSLMLFGLIGAVVLARGSVIKSVSMVLLGLGFGLVGPDLNSGTVRYDFGIRDLGDGIGFIPVVMGIYGIAEVVNNLEKTAVAKDIFTRIGRIWPSMSDIRLCFPSMFRGTLIGSALGLLPGGGALLASFAAYTLESKVAKPPRTFGHGDIRGVAAPETANNAGAQTSFIPMLTLGLPSNPTMALMIGALMIQGIAPGPRVMTDRPALFWGVVASMWLGNVMLVILNLPLVGIWTNLLRIPYRILFPAIVVFCSVGVLAVNNSMVELFIMVFFAVFGYAALKLDCEPAPFVLAFVLGPLMEQYLRRAMLISRGDATVFITEPVSLCFLIASMLLLLVIAIPMVQRKREEVMQEE